MVKIKEDFVMKACEKAVYSFNWKTREQVVKSILELANTKGITHDQLKVKYQELITSRNSF